MVTTQKGSAVARYVSCDYEKRCFYVGFGYKDRDSVQVRLEENNQDVYLSYTTGDGRDIHSITIPWADFVERFKAMVETV